MQQKLTITIDEEMYQGLHDLADRRRLKASRRWNETVRLGLDIRPYGFGQGSNAPLCFLSFRHLVLL